MFDCKNGIYECGLSDCVFEECGMGCGFGVVEDVGRVEDEFERRD